MKNKENTIGIPMDDCLAGEDPITLLKDSSDLAIIISLEKAALIEALREENIDLALMPDVSGLEEEAKLGNLFAKWEYAQSSAGSSGLTQRIKQEIQAQRDKRIERCFGLKIKYPDILRTIVREEDAEMMWNRILGGMPLEVIADKETAITQYPELLIFYFKQRLRRTLNERKVRRVEEDVLQKLREQKELQNPVLAYTPFDWVRNGDQVRKFGLVPIDEYIRPESILVRPPDIGFRSYPSIWRKDKLSPENQSRVLELEQNLKERLMQVVEIDERSAKTVLWKNRKKLIEKVLYR